ncbi:hypothetical protein [Saccharothrix yanglingensis]|uniref:Uncharacterized protein n=1 Tax=Saccharothrix yanglingensis TaxID=659496 RepID=A0ABU0X7L1_9PSEU|nr:hypothetical protein [Saccharothrix yanglingensis]MDQ2587961.1 hypothetical protein [Saccharothrix yanglingensis]
MTAYDIADKLPAIPELRDLCRVLAVLDAVLDPDNEDRHHSYDPAWAPGEELASQKDGGGNEYSIVFTASGAYVRGFDHESPISPYATDDGKPWPGVTDSVPEVFRAQVDEPAFTDEGTPCVTVCLWREWGDARWRHGDIAFPDDAQDGADWLFDLLIDGSPEAFQDWAQDYYQQPVDLEAVRHLYAGRPLTTEVVAALNPATTLAAIADDIHRIGFPISGSPA